MVVRICDVCGKQKTVERPGFHKFTHQYGILKNTENFDICQDCWDLIKSFAQRDNKGGEE